LICHIFHKLTSHRLQALDILVDLPTSQMEKDLIKNFKLAEKYNPDLETTQDYSEENVKQIVHEVLEEIKQKDFGKRKQP